MIEIDICEIKKLKLQVLNWINLQVQEEYFLIWSLNVSV